MSIKSRLSKLENRHETETDMAGLNELADMLYGKEDRPQINQRESVWANLKRIIPAPGEKV